MTDAPPPLLEIEELSIRFPTGRGQYLTAVDNISLTVGKGEAVGLVGESGSGKTLSALAIPGIVPKPGEVTARRITLDGTDIHNLGEPDLRRLRGRRIGMIFQEPMNSLNPTMTIGDQVSESLQIHASLRGADAGEAACEMLRRVRLPDPGATMRAYPHQLSGGMQQRAMIAMALACGPDLLIADEPTTALDVTVQAEILDLIDEVRRDSGMSVLFITHNLAVVARIADRIAVMQEGRIVETGPTDATLADPQSAYARSLLSAVPRLGAGRHPDKMPVIADAKNILSARSISKSYDISGGLFRKGQRRTVLQPTDIAIRNGETLALVGPSGCGKTTLARCLARLIPVDGGEVLLDGKPVDGRGDRLRNAVQLVFQDPFGSLDPRWTVGAILREPLVIGRRGTTAEQDARIAAALERVGLDQDVAARYPHQFSGGQRQRIAIARALMLQPRIIIADEPVSALDVTVQARILDLLTGLQAEYGLAILLISHDIAIVERLADRVAVMEDGRIVESGPTGQVLAAPRSDTARRLIDAVPRLPERAA
jgi:peptide/nickel transport system ATP-binding protein